MSTCLNIKNGPRGTNNFSSTIEYMICIAGLGNPGKKYISTWHNIGFIIVEQLHSHNENVFSPFHLEKQHRSEISQGNLFDQKIILAKPQTFMNNSGYALQAIRHYYKISPRDIWIVHDDVDLPLGRIRISHTSSAGGHHGVESIIEHMGTKNMVRFRIGIATDEMTKGSVETYVLKKVPTKHRALLAHTTQRAEDAIIQALRQGIDSAMNQFN